MHGRRPWSVTVTVVVTVVTAVWLAGSGNKRTSFPHALEMFGRALAAITDARIAREAQRQLARALTVRSSAAEQLHQNVRHHALVKEICHRRLHAETRVSLFECFP